MSEQQLRDRYGALYWAAYRARVCRKEFERTADPAQFTNAKRVELELDAVIEAQRKTWQHDAAPDSWSEKGEYIGP